MRKFLKIRTYAFLPHDLSIKLFFIVHFPPSFNLNGNKKSVALLQLDLRRNATRCTFIIADLDGNFKCFLHDFRLADPTFCNHHAAG